MAKQTDLTNLARSLGMRYYEEHQLLFGKVNGYECSVRQQPEKRMLMVHVTARAKTAEDQKMERFLEGIKEEDPAVTAAVYENFTASLRIDTGTEDPLSAAGELVKKVSAFAKEAGYLPCCSGCGKTKDVRRFLDESDARMFCPSCRVKAETELTARWQKKTFPRHSVVKAIVVVMVILLIGATSWIGIYTTGNSATLVGVAMTALCFLGWQYMAGRMRAGSIIGVLAALLITVFLCHNLCVAFELVIAIGQTREVSITGAFLFIPSFLKDPTNREVYFLQLGLAVLAVALTAAPMLWMVHRTWHHKERMESLEEPDA